MKILFGEVEQDIAEMIIADGGKITEVDGNYFEFEMTADEDCVRIQDGCGRYLVFDHKNIARMIEALEIMNEYSVTLATAERLRDELCDADNVWTVTADEDC